MFVLYNWHAHCRSVITGTINRSDWRHIYASHKPHNQIPIFLILLLLSVCFSLCHIIIIIIIISGSSCSSRPDTKRRYADRPSRDTDTKSYCIMALAQSLQRSYTAVFVDTAGIWSALWPVGIHRKQHTHIFFSYVLPFTAFSILEKLKTVEIVHS